MTIQLYELVGADPERPFSPHCWKTVMALTHKGLEWTSLPRRFTEIAGIRPESKIVPVIVDGERTVADSFQIALYLEERYPDRPTLFGGEGGKAMARFVEGWVMTQLHSVLGMAAIMDIHACLDPDDREYLRKSREARFGMTLEAAGEKGAELLSQLNSRLDPLRVMLKHQPFIGGQTPLFSDYIVFGAFQWVRIIMPQTVLRHDDPVTDWFESCLDLHDGLARRVPAAA